MICPRCAKEKDGIHTCTPSEFVREIEAQVAALTKEREKVITKIINMRWTHSADVAAAIRSMK